MTTQLPFGVLREVDATIAKRFPEAHDPTSLATLTEAQVEAIHVASRNEAALARKAVDVVQPLGTVAMGSGTHKYLVAALATEHRTVLAQIAKAVAEAILTPRTDQLCPLDAGRPAHPIHDGRFTCDTAIGASLMAYQPLI